MQKQTPQKQINIDISKTTPIKCDAEGCDNDMFMSATKFRKVSKLLTGNKEDGIIPVEVYMCTACGTVPKMFDLDV